jgi:hypothetical protein
LAFGIGTGGVFFNAAKGSSEDSSESGRQSAPRAAGDVRSGSLGSLSGPSNVRRVEGGLVLAVKGDVAPYKLLLRGVCSVGRVRGVELARFVARATALTRFLPAL